MVSHKRAVLSILTVRIWLASGLNTALSIQFSCPWNSARRLPSVSHRRAVLSTLEVRICFPSGLNINTPLLPQRSCLNVIKRLPLTSHMRTVPALTVRICLPSGLNTALSTHCSCPRNTATCPPGACTGCPVPAAEGASVAGE